MGLNYFCYHEWTQSHGIFWIEDILNVLDKSATDSSIELNPLEFSDNKYQYVFSKSGAVYTHDAKMGTADTSIEFRNNTYEHIFTLDSAIMKASIVQNSTTTDHPIIVHRFNDETVHEV